MDLNDSLKEIGLTDSESKVYLALLKLGTSAKGAILKETKTAPSKIYHVLEKLKEKGLVSEFLKNKVKQFSAASPERIRDYLEKKKESVVKQEAALSKVLPQLKKVEGIGVGSISAEIFYGWQGMEMAYYEMFKVAKKGDTHRVIGASKGANMEKTKEFYVRIGSRLVKKKDIELKILFNESSREYAAQAQKEAEINYNMKFLSITTPVEISVIQNITAIVRHAETPLVFLIRDKETAKSFLQYFEELWKQGKR